MNDLELFLDGVLESLTSSDDIKTTYLDGYIDAIKMVKDKTEASK